MKPTIMLCVATVSLSACVSIPMQPEIYQASATGGDFSLLNCNQLNTAEGSVRQRITTNAEGGVYTFGVFTPEGAPVAERTDILSQNAQELDQLRASRNCNPDGSQAAAAPASPQATDVAPVQATSAPVGAGRFMQVATFASIENRDVAIREFQARGVDASAQPITIGGRSYHRILLGPLQSSEDVAKADQAASALGLNDGFFVEG